MSKEKETFSIAEETKLGFNIFNISVLVHAKRVEKKQSRKETSWGSAVFALYTFCQQFVLYEEDTVLWDKQYQPKL